MPTPRVSVIIPTYNRVAFIGDTVDSVLAQSFPDLEVIVVDDGSTDGTADLLHSKYAAEPRVRPVWQANAERSVARNTGIREARGAWLAFLDSDDLWRPDKLARQMAALEADPSLVMAHGAYERVDETTGRADAVVISGGEGRVSGHVFWSLVDSNPVSSATPVIRRSIVERCGGFTLNRRLLCFEDWDLWTRVAYHGRVAYIDVPLATHRLHRGNTERPVTGAVYRQFIASILAAVMPADAPRVRAVATGRFMDLMREAMRDAGTGAARGVLAEAVRAVGPRFLREVSADRWLVAELLVGRAGGRRAVDAYARTRRRLGLGRAPHAGGAA